MRRRVQAGIVLATLVVLGAASRPSPASGGSHWLGVWAASPSGARNAGFADQSLRLIVTPTAGGRRVRVRLSNRFGDGPVTFSAASIARRAAGAALVPHSVRRLRFDGRRRVTIPAGQEVVSDGVRLRVAAFQDLAVSLHVRGASGPATEHVIALQTSYASPPGGGNHVADRQGDAFTLATDTRPYLIDVEVRAPVRLGAVIAFGDSLTDGVGSDLDRGGRYPDFRARRLAAAGDGRLALSVLNAGIGGTMLLEDEAFFGPSALHRLRADVIDQAGARVVIVLEGTNDIDGSAAKTDAVIAGLGEVVAELQAAGLSVLLGTQTPSKGTGFRPHGAPATIAARNRINDWIRTSGIADGVVDFHAAVRDPADVDRLRPEYDSGDHLHPNADGYEAMAAAVELELVRGRAVIGKPSRVSTTR